MGGGHTTMATNNNPGVFGWIGVWSAGAQDTPEFNAPSRRSRRRA